MFVSAAIDVVMALVFIFVGLFGWHAIELDEVMFGIVHLVGIAVAAGAYDL